MHTMFLKDNDKEHLTPHDAGIDDGEIVDFDGTDLAHAEVEEGIVSLYTDGQHFYHTLSEHDHLRVASLFGASQAPEVMIEPDALTHLGMAVMNCFASGESDPFDEYDLVEAHLHNLLSKYEKAIEELSSDDEVLKAIGAMVQARFEEMEREKKLAG